MELLDSPKKELDIFLYIVVIGGYFFVKDNKDISRFGTDAESIALIGLFLLFCVAIYFTIKNIYTIIRSGKIYRNRLQLNEEFKSKFLILNSFDDTKYTNIKIVNIEDKTQEKAMFKLYIQAELLNADALLLNDTNVSTEVKGGISTDYHGRVSGGTSSSSTFHITATLLKNIIFKDI